MNPSHSGYLSLKCQLLIVLMLMLAVSCAYTLMLAASVYRVIFKVLNFFAIFMILVPVVKIISTKVLPRHAFILVHVVHS